MLEINHAPRSIILKSMVTHTLTYSLAGVLALTMFHYAEQFADPNYTYPMRLVSDPLVYAGPLFQPLRGLLFGVIFYLLREVLFRPRDGWLIIWLLLFIGGIVNPFGPAPGSIEGLIYTTPSVWSQILGLREVIFQTFIFALLVWYWVRHPDKRWLNWLLWALFVLMLLMSVLGVLQITGRLLS